MGAASASNAVAGAPAPGPWAGVIRAERRILRSQTAMKKVMAAIAFAGLALASVVGVAADDTPLAKGDPEAGKELSQPCVACHGPKGNSPEGQWPNIAGQHAGYLFKQLKSFKAGEERSNAQMAGMVADLSPADMRDLAAYYAAQPKKTMGASEEELVQRGREIYLGGLPDKGVAACVACHGPKGRGNPAAGYPRVGGQWAQYLDQQLRHFRSGERANDAQAMMRTLAGDMSDTEIRAVSEYMAGLH
jgi:cytochrome c553